MFFGKNSRPDNEKSVISVTITPTVYPIIKYTIPSDVPDITIAPTLPDNTGALPNDFPPETGIPIDEAFELRSRIPMVENDFSIDFDYKNFKFVIKLKPPYDISLTHFKVWMDDNGYSKITKDKFIYINNP